MVSGRAETTRFRAATFAAVVVGLGCSACSKDERRSASTLSEKASIASNGAGGSKAAEFPRDATVIDFLGDPERCSFGHRGILLDLGDPSTRARMSGARLAVPDLELREREGASWVAVRSRSLELSFVAASEMKAESGVVVEARARGGAAKSASVYLNGKPIGTMPLTKGEATTFSIRTNLASVLRGSNELLLRFNGGARGQHDQLAEIDWVRVGPNDGDAPFSAPTRNDAVTTVSVANVARRAISLRAPGFARCAAFIPNGSTLEGFVGTAGGEADAEVRVLVDRAEPRVVGSFHLGGTGEGASWKPISLALGDIGTVAAIELVAKSSAKGARVAFAEARVLRPVEAPEVLRVATPVAAARGVILVVLGSTSRRTSIYGATTTMPELASLAASGTLFEAHRATSSFASGALGSMLTGLTPREHGADGADFSVSPSVFTIAEAARQAGIVTAMFTANPTTTAPFGFSRGWETFVARQPGDDGAATAIFDDVAKWLEQHKNERFLVVLHARGGHPPWDVTSEELKELPPQGYQGSLEPKHSGEALAKARKAGGRAFADPDRERAFALHAKALAAHDAALGGLVARVRSIGRDADTAWIVTSDVGVDAAARVPFLDDDSLEEGALAIPLVLRGIGPRSRDRVATATSGIDVARTILESLGLSAPPRLKGESLWTIARGKDPSIERPTIASTATRFSVRWGSFALIGAREREVKVCNLALDPDCVSDVRPSHPIASESLHALAWTELVMRGERPTTAGEPAFASAPAASGAALPGAAPGAAPDPATAAAVRAGGR